VIYHLLCSTCVKKHSLVVESDLQSIARCLFLPAAQLLGDILSANTGAGEPLAAIARVGNHGVSPDASRFV